MKALDGMLLLQGSELNHYLHLAQTLKVFLNPCFFHHGYDSDVPSSLYHSMCKYTGELARDLSSSLMYLLLHRLKF